MNPAGHPSSLYLIRRLQLERLLRSLFFIGAYSAWTLAFRLLVLTFVTYFLMSSGRSPRFEDISETFGANELTVMGMSAVLFVAILRALYPISTTTTAEIFTPARFQRGFLPGFAHGAILAAGATLAFLVSGHYRYLGFFVQFDEAPLAVVTVAVRILALGLFAYCEEFVFRHKISRELLRQVRGGKAPTLSSSLVTAVIVAIVYCGVKLLQFDLGVMQMFTLFLVSIHLSMQSFVDGDFGRGAGFWAALLIVFQPLLSLPALGGDFSGVVLIKFQPSAAAAEGGDALARFLTGGAGGPLSSIALQLLIAFDIARGIFFYKKKLASSASPPKPTKPKSNDALGSDQGLGVR